MGQAKRLRLGVLISGSGTNLQAIIDASESGALDADIAVVISSHEAAGGLARAERHGIDALHVDRGAFDTASAYNARLLEEFRIRDVDLVVMAGYMRLLGREVLDAYPHAVVNLHPALLPSFPGANGIRDAFEYGVKVTGVTVHFANEVFDEGPVIAQEAVRIEEDDTLASLEARIHEAEHRLYPAALQMIARGRVQVEGRCVRIASGD